MVLAGVAVFGQFVHQSFALPTTNLDGRSVGAKNAAATRHPYSAASIFFGDDVETKALAKSDVPNSQSGRLGIAP